MSQTENVAVATQEVLRITISDVLGLLAQGKSRKEIAEHYGRTQTEMQKIVWSHPKLKGRKIKKQYTGIELEDDTEEEVEVVAETTEVVEEDQAPTPEYVHTPAPELANAFPTEASVEATAPSTSDWN